MGRCSWLYQRRLAAVKRKQEGPEEARGPTGRTALRAVRSDSHRIGDGEVVKERFLRPLPGLVRRPASGLVGWCMEAGRDGGEARREWGEVPCMPDDGDYRKDRPRTPQYLAIRVYKRQESLFSDGRAVHHFAVVTNRAGDGLALLQWHREKAGTVEHTHHVLKYELAEGPLPSEKFGAKAA